MKSKTNMIRHLTGTSGGKVHRVGPRPLHIITAASTRARESIADAKHGKVNIGKEGPTKITGKTTGLPKVRGHHA